MFFFSKNFQVKTFSKTPAGGSTPLESSPAPPELGESAGGVKRSCARTRFSAARSPERVKPRRGCGGGRVFFGLKKHVFFFLKWGGVCFFVFFDVDSYSFDFLCFLLMVWFL